MDKAERDKQISYARNQFECSKMRAMYWHAMAITGAATMRNLTRGREVRPEEKEQGKHIGWVPLTDQEKVRDALEIMNRHIRLLGED